MRLALVQLTFACEGASITVTATAFGFTLTFDTLATGLVVFDVVFEVCKQDTSNQEPFTTMSL